MNVKMKGVWKRIFAAYLSAVLAAGVMPAASAYNGWADEYFDFCIARGIISGDENGDLMPDNYLTREQMTKMVLKALSVDMASFTPVYYEDVEPSRWSYAYISRFSAFRDKNERKFFPSETVTREEFLAVTVKVGGYEKTDIGNEDILKKNFSDADKVSKKYYNLISVGYKKNFISGDAGKLRPGDLLTRAEACAMLYRIVNAVEDDRVAEYYRKKLASDPAAVISRPKKNDEPVVYTYHYEKEFDDIPEAADDTASNKEEKKEETPADEFEKTNVSLMGKSEATIEQAKAWARSKGAAERFLDVCDYYWKYGELTGIRADVMYAQAAKETGYGKYGGKVLPEFNNWAGIKKYGATGSAPEDFEVFDTPEDGVRGHFNHMCAYVGAEPVGEVHGRYRSVKSLDWAGSVKTVDDLVGRWCPDKDYAYTLVNNFLNPMINTKAV